jgi:hypothetical protein
MAKKKLIIDHSTIPEVRERIAREMAKKLAIWTQKSNSSPAPKKDIRSLLAKLKNNQRNEIPKPPK